MCEAKFNVKTTRVQADSITSILSKLVLYQLKCEMSENNRNGLKFFYKLNSARDQHSNFLNLIYKLKKIMAVMIYLNGSFMLVSI